MAFDTEYSAKLTKSKHLEQLTAYLRAAYSGTTTDQPTWTSIVDAILAAATTAIATPNTPMIVAAANYDFGGFANNANHGATILPSGIRGNDAITTSVVRGFAGVVPPALLDGDFNLEKNGERAHVKVAGAANMTINYNGTKFTIAGGALVVTA